MLRMAALYTVSDDALGFEPACMLRTVFFTIAKNTQLVDYIG